uniref:Uncharacterized protein n=1 Tax=Oryza barthii TaxID=65489 RepID=A0A0D3HUX9_9ORYZ
MGQCACLGGGRTRRVEGGARQGRRGRAAEEEFDRSAAGRAAKAQMKAMKEAKTSSNQGEPVLKWQMGSLIMVLDSS